MDKLISKEWWKDAGTRMIKTFFQVFVATIGTSAVMIQDVPWLVVLSTSALSAILSLATSIATIPDPERKSEKGDDDNEY